MGIEIDVLALENWYDLLAFLSRAQLGQLASRLGNRRFASIIQTFLHKYVRQITLRPINVLETTNGSANDLSKARVISWKSYRLGREEFPVADWPMPENITNFESIQLSYLDFSVLRFLQQFQQNSLFTNINLQITTKYKANISKIAQCLSHLLPMIASIDSIELQGRNLINEIYEKYFSRYRCTPNNTEEIDCAQIVSKMINQTRILEISENFYLGNTHHFNCLFRWLFTPRKDGNAKVLLILGKYIYPGHLPPLVERIKGVLDSWPFFHLYNTKPLSAGFLMAKQAASYFIGIQTEPVGLFYNIARVQMETLTNSQTNERLTCKKGRLWPNKPELVLISRHPVDAAQEWIVANEKEIVERKRRKQYRKIELNGLFIGIGPMEMESPSSSPPPPPPPIPPPNIFGKFLSNLKKIGK